MLDIHAFEGRHPSQVHSCQISDFGQHHDGFGKPKLDVSGIFFVVKGLAYSHYPQVKQLIVVMSNLGLFQE